MFRRKGESLTRNDVVQAALYCLELEGEKSLGVNRVARELNIKPPSIYNHIQNNDELRIAVAIEGWKKLYNTLVLADLFNKDKKDSITLLLNTFRNFAHNNKNLYMVISTTFIDQNRADFLEVSKPFFELFNKLLSNFNIPKKEQIHVLRWLRSMSHGFIILELQKQFELPENVNQSYEFLIKTVIDFLTIKK